jgi:hypothetical protein
MYIKKSMSIRRKLPPPQTSGFACVIDNVIGLVENPTFVGVKNVAVSVDDMSHNYSSMAIQFQEDDNHLEMGHEFEEDDNHIEMGHEFEEDDNHLEMGHEFEEDDNHLEMGHEFEEDDNHLEMGHEFEEDDNHLEMGHEFEEEVYTWGKYRDHNDDKYNLKMEFGNRDHEDDLFTMDADANEGGEVMLGTRRRNQRHKKRKTKVDVPNRLKNYPYDVIGELIDVPNTLKKYPYDVIGELIKKQFMIGSKFKQGGKNKTLLDKYTGTPKTNRKDIHSLYVIGGENACNDLDNLLGNHLRKDLVPKFYKELTQFEKSHELFKQIFMKKIVKVYMIGSDKIDVQQYPRTTISRHGERNLVFQKDFCTCDTPGVETSDFCTCDTPGVETSDFCTCDTPGVETSGFCTCDSEDSD